MRRRTKIICTLGPATSSPETIRDLVRAGMDVARLNFSHGTHEQHAALCSRVREAANATGRSVAVLADLQGPKIRLGRFLGGAAVLEPGAVFVVSGEPMEGTCERASVSYGGLAGDLRPGDTLLIDDGSVKLRALASDGREVSCEVVEGGPLSDCKGVNLPGARLSITALTEKDVVDLRFALAIGADLIALSFVRSAEDALGVRQIMDDVGRHVPVIAKIERPEAVEELDAVLDAFDGLMVARPPRKTAWRRCRSSPTSPPHGRGRSPMRRSQSPTVWAHAPWSRSPAPGGQPTAWPATDPGSRCWRSRRTRRCAASWP